MMRSGDLVPLLARKAPPGVGFRQGTVLAWDADTADNVVLVDGAEMSNLTVLSASEVKVIQPGDQVSILTLGNGAKSWFILGKVTVPGGAELAIVQSANYDPGAAGYSVNRDGSAEFQDLTARGDISAQSITLPPNAGAGIPRLVLGPNLPSPLDTYLWAGSELAVGGIIYRQGDAGDDNYTFLVMVVFAGQVLVHLGHVLNGVMQEITPGFPKGQAWSYNGVGVQTEIHSGGSEDTLTIGNRRTGNASGGDFTNLDIIANIRVGGNLGFTPSNPPPSLTTKGDIAADGDVTVAGASVPRGIVGENSPTNAATTTTIEAFRGTITATLAAGRKYLLEYVGQTQSTVAGDLLQLRLRYQSGASVTSSGTLIQAMAQHVDVASRNQPVALRKSFTVASSGQYTVGVSIARIGGSGNVKLDYAAGLVEPYLLLTDIGAA